MDQYKDYLENDFIIWNGELGVRDFVTIGEIDSKNKRAWLDEPYDMVGPFCLDELCITGIISFAACNVMSEKYWHENRILIQEESIKKQQKLQEKLFREINDYNKKRSQFHSNSLHTCEKEHRELLCLHIEGALEVSQIKSAYRLVVKKAHPDVGGSHEKFIQITEARDALLEKYTLS